MTSMATQRVLCLPELLSLILTFLQNDPSSLRSASRVNSEWNLHSQKLLWREPPPSALLQISETRRQAYADLIHSLSFNCEQDHSQYTSLRFPQLRRVSIDTYRPTSPSPWIRQYLQPALQEFEFYGGNIHEDLRPLLSTHCPGLRKLLLDNIGTDIPADNFVDFLRSFRGLEDITLFYDVDFTKQVPADVFCYLAGLKSLKSLGLLTPVSIHAIRLATCCSVDHPFPNLRHLEIEIQASALSTLVSLISSNLKSLELTIEDDTQHLPEKFLSQISPLRDLEVLHLPCPAPGLLNENFSALKNFTKLREFRVYDPGGNISLWKMSRERLDGIFHCLPKLEYVEIEPHMDDVSDLLISLGRNCPLLKECILRGMCPLLRLQDFPMALFPCLMKWDIDIWVERGDDSNPDGGRSDAESAVRAIQCSAPKLEHLEVHCGFGNEFSKEVDRLWKLFSQKFKDD